MEKAWDWAEPSGVLSACQNVNGCNIEWDNSSDAETTNYDVASCNNGASNPCILYKSSDSNYRSQYTSSRASGNTPSIYTRVIKITDSGTDREVQVTSSVSWNANIFGGTRTVVLTSYLYNLYAD